VALWGPDELHKLHIGLSTRGGCGGVGGCDAQAKFSTYDKLRYSPIGSLATRVCRMEDAAGAASDKAQIVIDTALVSTNLESGTALEIQNSLFWLVQMFPTE
jgi:hypothetical protein